MKRNESISLADQRMQSRSIDELYDSESKERLSSHEFGLDGSNLRTESTVSPRRNLSQDPTADVSEGINKEGYVYSQKYKAMNTFEKAGYEIMTYFESFLASDSYMKDKKQRIHQAMLQVQTEEHKLEEKGNLFLAVMQGDIDAIKEYLLNLPPKEQINCVDKRDSVGGNIIHAAYLYEKYDIGQWLIVTYPEVGIKPFSRELTTEATDKVAKVCGMIPNSHDMLYSGENILHMAIVRKNLAETRWILDFYRWHKDSVEGGLEKLLLGNADGNFFEKDGEFYCGCYPLHFAACTNVTELFDLVLSYVSSFGGDSEAPKESTSNDDKKHLDVGANAIFMRDRYGNNCLHLCVLKNLKEMYVHIKSRSQKIIRKEITLKYIHVLDEYFKDGKYDEITAKGRVPIELNKLPETDGFDMGYLPKEILLESAPSDAKTKAYQDWLAKLTEKKVQERLDLVLNCDYHSPITLCASQFTNPQAKDYKVKEDRKREMLEFLLHEMKIVLWTYGSVRTSLISMEGIEFAYYPEGYNNLPASVAKEMFGVVEWLCITKSNACAKIPEVQKIISAKWHLYGLKIFLQQFYFRFFLTLLLFIVLLLANSTPFKNTVGSPDAAYLAAFLYPFILILISITSIYNLPLLWEYGFDYWGLRTGFSHRHVRGAAKYEKLMDTFLVLSYVSVFVNVFLRFNSQNDDTYGDIGTKISLTVCILVAWMYLFYFFMGFESTGPFVLTIYRIVSSDIPYFVMFYFLVIVAFGCSLSLLTNNGDPTIGYNVGHVLYTMYDLIQVTVSLQQNGNFHDELNSTFVPEQLVTIFSFLLTIFYFIVVLMFLNLLIAMINNTYSLYKEFDDATFLIEKYNIMSVIQKKQALIKGNARHIPNSYCLLDINDNKSTELAKPKPTPMFHLHRKSMDAKTVSEDDITQESALERPR